MIAPSASCWSRRTWPRRSRRKCTVQRCHGAPRTCSRAAFRPGCASLIASSTPTSPRATSERRNSRQNASVSASPTSRPMISRRPVSWTACAMTTHLRATRPPSRTFSTLASTNRYGATLQPPLTERLHLLIQQPRDPADLALADPQSEALDELIDTPRRDAADIGLLHDRYQRLLAALPGLQDRREVAALTDLRDLQLDLTRPRIPPPWPIAIAMRHAIFGPALTMGGADQLRHLRLHQLLRHQAHGLADHVTVLLAQHLPDDLLDRHPLGTGHRWRLLSSTPWNEPTILSATVAGTTSATSFRPTRTYTTLRDVTPAGRTARPATRWTRSARPPAASAARCRAAPPGCPARSDATSPTALKPGPARRPATRSGAARPATRAATAST